MKIDSWPLALKKQHFSRLYLFVLFFVLRRGLQGAYAHDDFSKTELESLGEHFSLGITVADAGPSFILQLTNRKKKPCFDYIGTFKKNPDFKPDLKIQLKSIGSAMQIFCFKESISEAEANSRFIADGSLEAACTFIRVLERTEMILLPRFIAKHAVKRYQSFKKLNSLRVKLYGKVLFG